MAEQLTKWHGIMHLANASFSVGVLTMPYIIGIAGWHSFIAIISAVLMTTYAAICLAKVTIETIQQKPNHNTNYNATATSPSKSEIVKTTELSALHTTIDNDVSHIQIEDESASNSSTQESQEKKSVISKISRASLGIYGEIYGVVGFLVTLFLVDIILLIQSFDLFKQILLSFADQNSHILLNGYFIFLWTTILMIPTCFALNWSQMVWISILSNISAGIAILMIVYVFIYFKMTSNSESLPNDSETDNLNIVKHVQENMYTISIICYAFIVFVYSLAGHLAIPSIINSLKIKKDIYFIIIFTYLVIAIIYVISGILGYFVYQEYTHVFAINNVFIWPGGWVIISVCFTILLNLIGSYGLMSCLFCEIIDHLLKYNVNNKTKRKLIRIIYLILSVFIAYFGRNYLAFWFAIVGVFGASFGPGLLMMFLFYIGMFWNKMSKFSSIIHCMLLILSIIIGIFIVYSSITGLL